MKITKRQLSRIIREESETTIKYNADDALKGDQTKLPDALQKGIIDAEEDEEKVEEALRSLIRNSLMEAGLWDNVHAKRKRGETPAKKGDKDYPDEDSWKAAQESDDAGEGTLEEAMLYHIGSGVGVDQNIYRPGSTAFFALFREARRRFHEGKYEPRNLEEYELLEALDIGEFAIYEGQLVPLDYPIMQGNEEHLNEAEYDSRKVELNKPIQGSPKAYVYVNSGKKDKDGKIKVKKVSFGSSMPDAMGDSDASKARRKSFGARHNCADKDDKTAPGYWSCRATKFFGRDIAGWW